MGHRPPSIRQLRELLAEAEAVQARFDALHLRVDDATWSRRPRSDRWSVAECIAHLNLTADAMQSRARVVKDLSAWLERERELIRSAEGLAIDQVQVESPFRAGTFYDGWSALRVMLRHELRHLVQAERAVHAVEGR